MIRIKLPYETMDTHAGQGIPRKFRDSSLSDGRYKEQNIVECIPYSDPHVPGIQGQCSVLQCVAACCIVLHRVAVGYPFSQ